MKTLDPVVQEVHAIRQQLLDQAGGDLHQVVLQAHEMRRPNRKIVRGQARRPIDLGKGTVAGQEPDRFR